MHTYILYYIKDKKTLYSLNAQVHIIQKNFQCQSILSDYTDIEPISQSNLVHYKGITYTYLNKLVTVIPNPLTAPSLSGVTELLMNSP